MPQTCPNPELLRQFALGDLPRPEFEEVAAHVDACEACEASLGGLEGTVDDLTECLLRLSQSGEESVGDVPPPLVISATTFGKSLLSDDVASDGSASLDSGRWFANRLEHGPVRLGRFELQEKLGVGTFGYVFRAFDTELQRTVAVKIQRAGQLADGDDMHRFLREARSAARLEHPAIVSLYDAGETADGVCFLVTELIEGRTLEERLKGGPVAARQAADWVARLAGALHYAHQHGIVHRDVKPSNVMLDDDGLPHIMDFGLAKRDVGGSTVTQDGQVMGTPAYMSPEQARGDSHGVDARTDVYSLGVMLYELLTGERPFQGNRRLLLLQVLEDEPRPPRQLNDRIPRDLETICLKAMSRNPARRYRTAGEFADDLNRFLAGEPIQARSLGSLEKLGRWCRRYPLAAGLFLAVCIGAAATLVHLSWLTERLVQQTALDSARMEAGMLEEVNGFYSEIVGPIDRKLVPVTHEYLAHKGSLPLPATLTIDLGERISRTDIGMKVRVYSDYPWREHGDPKDGFARRALLELTERAAEEGTDAELSYYEFTDDNRLRYAKAQLMKQSCVKCHNGSKRSPKRNWAKGELAGIIEITRPLDRDIERTRRGLQGTFMLGGAIFLAFAILGGAAVAVGRARRRIPA